MVMNFWEGPLRDCGMWNAFPLDLLRAPCPLLRMPLWIGRWGLPSLQPGNVPRSFALSSFPGAAQLRGWMPEVSVRDAAVRALPGAGSRGWWWCGRCAGAAQRPEPGPGRARRSVSSFPLRRYSLVGESLSFEVRNIQIRIFFPRLTGYIAKGNVQNLLELPFPHPQNVHTSTRRAICLFWGLNKSWPGSS